MKHLAKSLLPSFVWDALGSAKSALASSGRLRALLEAAGLLVARQNDYYAPLSTVTALRSTSARWNRPSALQGIDYDLVAMRGTLSTLLDLYLPEFSQLPTYSELQRAGFGPGYTAVDALTLYMMIRHLKPRRYIEVGSGLSTYYCRLAADKNGEEGHPLSITCIEPYPYKRLLELPGLSIIESQVQDIDVGMFRDLSEDDVLFIDSSHVLKIDGDVPFLYLEVLPTLQPGVVIHIHDVPFPFNIPYPPSLWIFGRKWPMFWTEAMMVQAFLCMNRAFRIELSTPLIRYADEAFLQRSIPFYETIEQNPNSFSSLWLRRVSA
jgi:predicted O-methyltransferase YrrM